MFVWFFSASKTTGSFRAGAFSPGRNFNPLIAGYCTGCIPSVKERGKEIHMTVESSHVNPLVCEIFPR